MKIVTSPLGLVMLSCLIPILSYSMETTNQKKILNVLKTLQELCTDFINNNFAHQAIKLSQYRYLLLSTYKNLLIEKNKETIKPNLNNFSILEQPKPLDLDINILLTYIKFAESLQLGSEVQHEEREKVNEAMRSSKSVRTRIQFFDQQPIQC